MCRHTPRFVSAQGSRQRQTLRASLDGRFAAAGPFYVTICAKDDDAAQWELPGSHFALHASTRAAAAQPRSPRMHTMKHVHRDHLLQRSSLDLLWPLVCTTHEVRQRQIGGVAECQGS
jgi:hypothetical protein